VITQFILVFAIGLLSLLLLRFILKVSKISWQKIGVSRPTGRNILFAIPTFGVYLGLIAIIFTVINTFFPVIDLDQKQQLGFESAQAVGSLMLVFASLVLIPPIVEEIMVRGFLYGGLSSKLNKPLAAVIASGLFAVAHLQLGSGSSPVWVAAVDTFILSMVLIWLREKTGNIWAGVVVHMLKNSLAFVGLFILHSN
jgi:membrane protease YdiL (CAAX protease family)